MAEQFLLSLSLSLIIIEGFRARRANIRNFTLQTLHSEGIFLEIKLFLTYSLLSRFCLKFVKVFFAWYLTISRKDPLIIFQSVNIFVLNAITDITKLGLLDTVVVGCCCQ